MFNHHIGPASKLFVGVLVSAFLVACEDEDKNKEDTDTKNPEQTEIDQLCKLPPLTGLDRGAQKNTNTSYYKTGKKHWLERPLKYDLMIANHKNLKITGTFNIAPDKTGSFERSGRSLQVISETGSIQLMDGSEFRGGNSYPPTTGSNGQDGQAIKVIAKQGSIEIGATIIGNRGGPDGGDGGDIIICAKDKIIVGGKAFLNGGRGHSRPLTKRDNIATKNFSYYAQDGGDGGNIIFVGTGKTPVQVTLNGNTHAGHGGDGEAIQTKGAVGNERLEARGGSGGEGGRVRFINANYTVAKPAYLKAGNGGTGGSAEVFAGDGASIASPGTGAKAIATGGQGGSAGTFTKGGAAANHGAGGTAKASSGNGGASPNGSAQQSSGSAEARGGENGGPSPSGRKAEQKAGDPSGIPASVRQRGVPEAVQKTP